MAAKLLGWWPLHEGNGSSVTDQVTKVRTPINLPSPTTNWGSSPLGGALYLAANFECITNLPAMDQLIGAGDLTWSCRFMVDSLAAERHLLYLGDVGGVTNCMSLYVTAGGVLTFLCSNASSANTTHGVTIQTGSWYHVAVTRTGTTAQIYLQGAPNTAATDANYGVSIGSHHVVGATRIGASAWSGGISDVRLYNRVLSQPDIEMLLTDPYALLHRPDRLAMRGFAAIPLARPQHPRFELRTVGALVDYAQPVSRGLRAWWPISQGNGRDIRDIGPRNMTNSTAVIAYLTAWTGSAHGGSALKFEGAQNLQWSHATFTASLSSDGQSPWSTSTWIRPDEGLADGQYQILGKQVGSVNFSGWGLYVEVIGGSYRLGYTHRSTLEVRLCVTTESGTLVPGAWHHVVSAFDGSGAAAGVDLYINGARKVVLTESDTLGASTTNSGAAFIIGSRDTNGLFFQGLINQVRLYHRKLTREEAEAIYHDPWAGTHAPRYRHLLSGSEGVLLTTPDRHPHMAKPRPVLDPQVLKQGGSSLVAWWPFNEGGGSTTQDQHGQRHVATLTNMDGTAWVGTLHGGGLQFGGTDDYLSVPMHASLQPLRLTLAVWVRLDARPLTFASVIEAGDATTDGWSLVVDHTGAFGFVMKTAGGSQAGGYNQPRQLGHWTHVALTYNGESGGDALYIDGQPVAIGSLTALSRSDQGGVLAAPASALTFASKAGSSRFLTGALDDVRLYREALPASAIAQLYDSSANGQVDLSGRLLLGGATVTGGLVAVRARRMLWRT